MVRSIRYNQLGIPVKPIWPELRSDPLPSYTPAGVEVSSLERYDNEHTLNPLEITHFAINYRTKIRLNEDAMTTLVHCRLHEAIMKAVPEAEIRIFGTNTHDKFSDTESASVSFKNLLIRIYNGSLEEKPLEVKVFITPTVRWFGANKGAGLSVRVVDLHNNGIGTKVVAAVRDLLDYSARMDQKELICFFRPGEIKPRAEAESPKAAATADSVNIRPSTHSM
jgi:hypothetical protein